MGDRHKRTNKAMSKAHVQSWRATSRTEKAMFKAVGQDQVSTWSLEFGVFTTCTL